jgi:hypothetical protein
MKRSKSITSAAARTWVLSEAINKGWDPKTISKPEDVSKIEDGIRATLHSVPYP